MAELKISTRIATNFVAILEKIGDVTVANVWDEINTVKGKKKMLNLKLLIKSLVISIFTFGNNINNGANIKLDQNNISDQNDIDEYVTINVFINDIATAVENFCDFLDYDDDGIVELVEKNAKGEVVIGQDIKLMITEGKNAISSIKFQGNIQTIMFTIISSLVIYLTSEHITQSRKDFDRFYAACQSAHATLKLVKNVNLKKILTNNSNDLLKFVVILCIIIIPIINIVTTKIAQINNDVNNSSANIDSNSSNTIITQDEIKRSVLETYGLNLEFILASIEGLVTVSLKVVETTTTGKKCLNFLKHNFCCCFCSNDQQTLP